MPASPPTAERPARGPVPRGLAALGLLAALGGCPGFGDRIDPALRPHVPTWEVEVAPLFFRWCGACHTDPPVNGAPQALATYEQASRQLVRLRVRVVEQQTMPPGGGMPPADLETIAAWIEAGGPRSPADLEAPPDATVDAARPGGGPTWEGDVRPILLPACGFAGCHGAPGAQAGLDLTSWEGFMAGSRNGVLHGDGDPARSRLIHALRGRAGVPLMPPGQMLPEEAIARIEAWIAAGHPR
jgi:mono/diheme cytochrome c family protein